MHKCRWKAWRETNAGEPAAVVVWGACLFPADGYSVELSRAAPQTEHSRDLLLAMTIRKPTGAAVEVPTDVDILYREETDESFETVSIVPDGPAGIPVEQEP